MATHVCPLWLVVGIFDKGKVPSKPPTVGILRTVVWSLGVEDAKQAKSFQKLTVDVQDPSAHFGNDSSAREVVVLKIPVSISDKTAAEDYVRNNLDWFINAAHLVSLHPLQVRLDPSNITDPTGFFCVPTP